MNSYTPAELGIQYDRLRQEIQALRGELNGALDRIRILEGATPQARRLQYELDLALADNAAAGYRDDGGW